MARLVAALSLMDDHEGEDVFEGEGEGGVEEEEDAGAGDLVGFGEGDGVGEVDAAGADLLEGFFEDGELDGGGGLDDGVGGERGGLVGGEVFGVEGDVAVVGGGDGFELEVEGGLGRGEGGEEECGGEGLEEHGVDFSVDHSGVRR